LNDNQPIGFNKLYMVNESDPKITSSEEKNSNSELGDDTDILFEIQKEEAGQRTPKKESRLSKAFIRKKESEWERVIPWFLTIACTISLISIALFLILNVEWFKTGAFDHVNITNSYKIYIYHLHLSMIKRSVALFSGFAMMFVGASVCFYIVKTKTDVGFKGQNFSLNLITASPGIIAMILGASLIMFTIWSKDEFPAPGGDLPPVIQPENNNGDSK